MYALVDCNNFYASCERVFRPDLNGKPVVVLSNNDGCAIARSNEAKALGIPMGAPAFKYAHVFKKKNVQVFSANFPLYGDMSNRVMSILATYTPDIEIYSIDEAFLSLAGFGHRDMADYGGQMVKQTKKWTGIPISVGIAPTKGLAKVANRIAKKYPEKTGNVHVIDNEQLRVKALKWLPIGDVWGIGRRYAKRLRAIGVETAYDFCQLEPEWVKKTFSVVGWRLQRDLQGIPTLELDQVADKKQIATTRTFSHMIEAFSPLNERIATFTAACAEKLRQQNTLCRQVMIFVQTNSYREDLPQYSRNIVIPLEPTDSSILLIEAAHQGLKRIFKEGRHYKRAGVILSDFIPRSALQPELFPSIDRQRTDRHAPLMQTMDRINARYGRVAYIAAESARRWKMRQENLSPCYSTRLEDVMVVKAH